MTLVKIGLKRTKKAKPLVFELENDCIVCTSHTPTKDGYIRIYGGENSKPRMKHLHRIIWEELYGPIPIGYELDHKCRNRKCCNEKHLQLLTISQHKSKTNLERYSERIDLVITLILSGKSTKEIAKQCNVKTHYVTRYKRKLNYINHV